MARVLVTGASGFVGSATLPHLRARGFEVHTVGSSAVAPAEGHHHVCDLLGDDPEELMRRVRPSHLLHLAWSVGPDYRHSQENYWWVGASFRLARAFADAGGRRLVAAGTCAEYDWSGGICSEASTPLRPVTPYGVCKDALRRMLESFAATRGLSFAWGRLFFLYGPGERAERLVPSVIRPLLAGERARCTLGTQVRDFLFVDDVGSAFCDLLASDVEGAVNIGSGERVAIRDVVLAAARQLGAQDRVELGAVDGSGEAPLIVADIRRLRDEVGWRPHGDLHSGLRQSIDWWREREHSPC